MGVSRTALIVGWSIGLVLIGATAAIAAESATPSVPADSPPQASGDAGADDPLPDAPAADAELLDDPEYRPPGELTPKLEVIERDPSNWLGIPPEKEWLNLIRDPLRELDKEHGISITGAYTVLFQQASGGAGERNGSAGDFDLFIKWTPVGRGTPDTGTFVFAAEYRHDLGDSTPAELGGSLGTLLGTTNGFNDRGIAVKEAYWVQRFLDGRVRVGIGRADPENLVGGHKLQSANTSFLNKAFSTNPTIAFPGCGMTAAIAVEPVDWFYVAAGASNGYGNTTTMEIDRLFDHWDLFSFAEGGFTPEIEGLGEGRYRLAVWHVDSLDDEHRPSDWGLSVIVDQELGDRVSVFARYGYSEADVTGVRHLAEVGGAIKGLIGSREDLTGIAFAWAAPPDDPREEKVVELFHRMQLTGRTQFTPGVQMIIDPSNAQDDDVVAVFSFRFRLSF